MTASVGRGGDRRGVEALLEAVEEDLLDGAVGAALHLEVLARGHVEGRGDDLGEQGDTGAALGGGEADPEAAVSRRLT